MSGNHLRSYSIWIPLEPRGKGRPRFSRRGRHVATYTDDKTAAWEAQAAAIIRSEVLKLGGVPFDGPVMIRIAAVFARPKSKKHAPFHVVKPDADNVAKIVLDALVMSEMIGDDAQVFSIVVSKTYPTERYPLPGVALDVSMVVGGTNV